MVILLLLGGCWVTGDEVCLSLARGIIGKFEACGLAVDEHEVEELCEDAPDYVSCVQPCLRDVSCDVLVGDVESATYDACAVGCLSLAPDP